MDALYMCKISLLVRQKTACVWTSLKFRINLGHDEDDVIEIGELNIKQKNALIRLVNPQNFFGVSTCFEAHLNL